MTNRGVSAAVLALGVCSLGLSACSIVGGSDAGDAAGDAVSSPIAEFLGMDEFADPNTEAGRARIIEIQREINELVVACMAQQGFDYVPPNPDDTISFAAGSADGLEYGSAEYTARYGFGATTQYWSQTTVGPDLVGYDEIVADDIDPNAAYLDGLTDPERAAFEAALHGDGPEYPWDPSLSDDENLAQAQEFYLDRAPSGCMEEAQANSPYANLGAFYTEFGDELYDLSEQVTNDPRLVAQLDEIEQCVIAKGLEFVAPDDAFQHWNTQLNDIAEQHVTSPAAELTQSELDAMTPDELDDLFAAPETMDDEGKAKLAVLQAEEIAIAVATDDCGGSQAELSSLYAEVNAEYEQRFLDENADRLGGFASTEDGGS